MSPRMMLLLSDVPPGWKLTRTHAAPGGHEIELVHGATGNVVGTMGKTAEAALFDAIQRAKREPSA